jgi:hypothetical protein
LSIGGYEATVLLSGLAMSGTALLPRRKATDRAVFFAIGAGMVVYALYAAQQSSGVFVVPIQLIALAWVLLGKAVYDSYHASQGGVNHELAAGVARPVADVVSEPIPVLAPEPRIGEHRVCVMASCALGGRRVQLTECSDCGAATQYRAGAPA